MPNEDFIEQYPLYKKFKVEDFLASEFNRWPEVRINMTCETCKSPQTFAMASKYWDIFGSTGNIDATNKVFRMIYVCSHCRIFQRQFFVRTGPKLEWLMKVGQFPAWEIKGDPNVEQMLGEHASYYKKGLVCESQGYGIGAFAYFRRIVEETIDGLLDQITDLLSGDELAKYQVALEQTKQTTVTRDKIDLVKELLPPILRPDNMNPLTALHAALSEGLHAKSDEECLDHAESCREVLVFLVAQIAASKAAGKSFTDSMRKLLDRRTKDKSE